MSTFASAKYLKAKAVVISKKEGERGSKKAQRYTNLIGLYGYWLRHRQQLLPEERAEALRRIKQCFHTIERSEIRVSVKYRPFYFPWRAFAVFALQARVYFTLRKLVGR